jgi:hypothetical protein
MVKEHYIVKVNNKKFLAYKEDDKFYFDGFEGKTEILKEINDKIKITFPVKNKLNGWKLYSEELPNYDENDVYKPTEVVITYDINRGTIYESQWEPIRMQWIDAESMGGYNEHTPTHWKEL